VGRSAIELHGGASPTRDLGDAHHAPFRPRLAPPSSTPFDPPTSIDTVQIGSDKTSRRALRTYVRHGRRSSIHALRETSAADTRCRSPTPPKSYPQDSVDKLCVTPCPLGEDIGTNQAGLWT
jgi:hypothetical protein